MRLTQKQLCRYAIAGSTADKISRIIIQLNAYASQVEGQKVLVTFINQNRYPAIYAAFKIRQTSRRV